MARIIVLPRTARVVARVAILPCDRRLRTAGRAYAGILLPMKALSMLLLLCLVVATPATAERRTYAVGAAELTREAAARFPQRRCLLNLACVTLADPQVRLRNGDPRLFLSARASPEMGAQTLGEGTIELAGKPRYDPAQGAFFLDAPEILRVEFPGLPQAYVASAVELTRGLLIDSLRQMPVWVLDEKDSQQAIAKLVLRDVQVRDGKLRVVVGDED